MISLIGFAKVLKRSSGSLHLGKADLTQLFANLARGNETALRSAFGFLVGYNVRQFGQWLHPDLPELELVRI